MIFGPGEMRADTAKHMRSENTTLSLENKYMARMIFVLYQQDTKDVAATIKGLPLASVCQHISLVNNTPSKRKHSDTSNEGIDLIPGNNSAYEFSGWQAGIEACGANLSDSPVLLLGNDSALREPACSLPVICKQSIASVSEDRAIAGRMRKLPCKITYQGMDLSSYIQTHLFALSLEVLRDLGSVVSFDDPDEFMQTDFVPMPHASEKQDKLLPMFRKHEVWCDGFDKYVFQMLTQRWHNHGITYCEKSYGFFRRKVLSIMNELMLTARSRSLGHAVTDLTPLPWLCNSPALLNIPSRPIALQQACRNIAFRLIDTTFFNPASKRMKLDSWMQRFIQNTCLEADQPESLS